MTVQRQIIWNIVKHSHLHPTALQVFDEARQQGNISMATVYNSLNYLVENGFVQRVKIAGEPDHFDGRMEQHQHALCDSCGQVVDVFVNDIAAEIEKQCAIKVVSCGLNLHCICRQCLNK